MFIVTGPTGSGKSTTLYTLLQQINSPSRNIVTLEDPIEKKIPGINQGTIQPKAGFGFAEGLRAILRQDPNVIMVGEIRDTETAEIALSASMTGQLLLTTLHTVSALGAVNRLIDMGLEPFLVASALTAVTAQRLARAVCASCAGPDQATPEQRAEVETRARQAGIAAPAGYERGLRRGAGCDDCRGTGYRGRTGIYELFRITEDARSLVVRKAPVGEIRRHAVTQGMVTLREDAWAKACAGLTTVEEILRVTQEDT
jgi:general secretion pathway protein E